MKSLFLAFCFGALSSMAVGSSLDYFRPGEYAFYRDDRFSVPYYRGYVITKSNDGRFTVACRTINLKDNSENRFLFFLKDDDKGHAQVDGIAGEAKLDDSVLMQSMVDFLNFTMLYISNNSSIHLADSPITDDWDNRVYDFGQAYPFFRFRSIQEPGTRSICYSLEKAGVLNNQNIDLFNTTTAQGIVEGIRNVKVLAIPRGTSRNFKLGEHKLTADDRWYYNNNMGSPGLWLRLNTERDSQIMVETLPKKQIDSTYGGILDFLHLVLLVGVGVDYSSISVASTNPVEISYSLYDTANKNIKNITILKVFSDGDKYVLLNFSSFFDVYAKNKEYYQAILSSFAK